VPSFAVNLANEAVREREAVAKPGESRVAGSHVVRYLDDVVERHARSFVELEKQKSRASWPFQSRIAEEDLVLFNFR
jgi:hypothetical protein